MSTMNTSPAASMKSALDEPVTPHGVGTRNANQRELIREDQDRLHLRGLLLVGAATAPGDAADSAYFNSLRNRVRKAANAGSRE